MKRRIRLLRKDWPEFKDSCVEFYQCCKHMVLTAVLG